MIALCKKLLKVIIILYVLDRPASLVSWH